MPSTVRQFITAAAALTALAAVAPMASAQAKQSGKAAHAKLVWGPAPDAFPAGAKMAVESGNPMAAGEFVVRLSFPAGYKIPPHFHPTDEHVRVRSGALLVGMGDVLDPSKTKKLAPGDTGTIPATQHHFALARGATVISVRADGPFAMNYVKDADDPRKKTKAN
jgi:quercetin dioxygenase-like cupin family protein